MTTKLRIAAMSDMHGQLPPIPDCDLLLIGGDITPTKDHSIRYQAEWTDGRLRGWLNAAAPTQIVACAGNHDFIFQHAPGKVPGDLRWRYLQDSGTTVRGLRIWGSPWQPEFFDWAFNANPDKLRAMWRLIPDDTQILVLHGPPKGFGDLTTRDGRVGCPHLLERIRELPDLRLAVFGHIHGGHGVYQDGRVTLANVSVLDDRYQLVNPVTMFEWDGDDVKAVKE